MDASIHKPIYLLSVTLRNEYKPAYTFNFIDLDFYPAKPVIHAPNDPIPFGMTNSSRMSEEQGGSSYFIVIQAQPGQAINLNGISCLCVSNFTNGCYFAPFFIIVPAKATGIWYLGHIEGVIREGRPSDFSAGQPIPVLYQVQAGAIKGTWIIDTSDKWKSDMEVFDVMFPALKNAQVQMALLPPFDRARVQNWWDRCATYRGFSEGPGR